MFQMTVENVFKIRNSISVSGTCINKDKFKNKLADSSGNIYETYESLGKDLVIDDSFITLCFHGDMETDMLKGKILRNLED